MKKGDLVKLKEGAFWSDEEAKQMGYNTASEIPEYFEVEAAGWILDCCIPRAVFKAVGIEKFGFSQHDFDVALPAGEPDTIKLMEEAKELELASIGF